MNLSLTRTLFVLSRFLSAGRVFLLLAVVSLFLGLLTRQWLLRNTLLNPPSYDALVYQNQSYDDLQLIEKDGWMGIFKKYSSGNWHVPPLYMVLGTLTYIFGGLQPVNAYWVNAVFHFVFTWSVYSLFRYAGAGRIFCLFGALLLGCAPSVIGYALRHFMADFAAAAAFLLATALLLQSKRLTKRKAVIRYSLAAALSVLIKSSMLLYYWPHALLLLWWFVSDNRKRSRLLANFSLFLGINLVLTGWFYLPNLKQILKYYLGWAGSQSSVTKSAAGISSLSDSLLFYFRNVARFHFEGVGGKPIWGILLSILILGGVFRFRKQLGWDSTRAVSLLVLLVGQYSVLTAYPSKVNVVDYSMLPFYFLVPVAYLYSIPEMKLKPSWEKLAAKGLMFFLLCLTLNRSINLLLWASPIEERQDWRVKETLAEIIKDARNSGYSEVQVGSTPVHPYYTCENMRFYVLSDAFPQWRERFKIPQIGIAQSPEQMFSFVRDCDYIVTINGWQGPEQLPNNHIAPEVNSWLARGLGGFKQFYDEMIPGNSHVVVYKRDQHLTLDELQGDGWATAGFSLALTSKQPRVRIRINGKLPLPQSLAYPAHLYLTDSHQETVSNSITILDNTSFSKVLEVHMRPEWSGRIRLNLVSDRAYSPKDWGISSDNRRLMVMVSRIALEAE